MVLVHFKFRHGADQKKYKKFVEDRALACVQWVEYKFNWDTAEIQKNHNNYLERSSSLWHAFSVKIQGWRDFDEIDTTEYNNLLNTLTLEKSEKLRRIEMRKEILLSLAAECDVSVEEDAYKLFNI